MAETVRARKNPANSTAEHCQRFCWDALCTTRGLFSRAGRLLLSILRIKPATESPHGAADILNGWNLDAG